MLNISTFFFKYLKMLTNFSSLYFTGLMGFTLRERSQVDISQFTG